MSKGEELETKYDSFIKKHWPLPQPKVSLTPQQIRDIKRSAWYCNNSGHYIPELQQYNASDYVGEYNKATDRSCNCESTNPEEEPYDEDDEDPCEDLLSTKYYRKGYTNYRVYGNGVCFLDIHLLSAAFDYINSNFYPRPKEEDVMKHIINLCHGDGMDCVTERMDMYYTFTDMCTGTVILRPYIPHHILKHLTTEATFGDVYDTEGYRGTGLHVFDGKKSLKVDTGEYYPIWTPRFWKQRGLRYYLDGDVPETFFDGIQFDNGIELSIYCGFGSPVEQSVEFDFQGDTLNYKGKTITPDEDGYYNTPYPWDTNTEPDSLLDDSAVTEHKYRVKISKLDYLVFREGQLYLQDKDGEYQPDAMCEIERTPKQVRDRRIYKTFLTGGGYREDLGCILVQWKVCGVENVKKFQELEMDNVPLPDTWIYGVSGGGHYGSDINASDKRYIGLQKDSDEAMRVIKEHYKDFAKFCVFKSSNKHLDYSGHEEDWSAHCFDLLIQSRALSSATLPTRY